MNAGIEKLDLKSPVSNRALLPNELIHSRLPDLAHPFGIRINSMIFARSGALQLPSEEHRLTVFRRS